MPLKAATEGEFKKVLRGGGGWLADLLTMNTHMLGGAQAWLKIYSITLQRSSCVSSGPLCRAVLCLSESYKSFEVTMQVFLLTTGQFKPISNKCRTQREAASRYCSVLSQHHGCMFASLQRSCGVMSGNDAVILVRIL